jgi:hypothetical protein
MHCRRHLVAPPGHFLGFEVAVLFFGAAGGGLGRGVCTTGAACTAGRGLAGC